MLQRFTFPIGLALLALALGACGILTEDEDSSGGLPPADVAVTAMAPTAFPVNRATVFTLTGTDFDARGAFARVLFRALGGATPFEGGTSALAEVVGTVVDAGTIEGVAPLAVLCGTAGATFEVIVILGEEAESAPFAGNPGPLTLAGPTLGSFAPAQVPAVTPTAFTLTGATLPEPGTPCIVRFAGGGTVWQSGTQDFADVNAAVDTDTTILGATPESTTTSDFVASVQVLFLDGSCTGTTTANYRARVVTAFAPAAVPATIPVAFTITGVNLPAVGTPCVVRFSGGGMVWQGGTQSFADVNAQVGSATTVIGTTPASTTTADFAATVTVFFGPTAAAGSIVANYVAPPSITDIQNAVSFVDQDDPSGPLLNNLFLGPIVNLMEILGDNFQSGATVDLYRVIGGPAYPVGGGSATVNATTTAQIDCDTPVDAELGEQMVTVRVTNPDGQTATYDVPFSAAGVLENVNLVEANGGTDNGEQANVRAALNPADPDNIIAVTHDALGGSAPYSMTNSAILVKYTTDGGDTWNEVRVDDTVDGWNSYDERQWPDVVFDSFGTAWLCYVRRDNFSGYDDLALAYSVDGGATWSAYYQFWLTGYGGLSRPAIAVGPQVSSSNDQLIIAFGDQNTGPYLHCSSFDVYGPGSANYYSTDYVANSGYNVDSVNAFVSSQGETVVAWSYYTYDIYYFVDPDGPLNGGSWNGNYWMDLNQYYTGMIQTYSNYGYWQSTTIGMPYVEAAADTGTGSWPVWTEIKAGPYAGRKVFAATRNTDESNSGTGAPRIRYSTQDGTFQNGNITSGSYVGGGAGLAAFHPAIASDPVTGLVYLTWYDTADDPSGNNLVRRLSSVSADGQNWSAPIVLSQGQSDDAISTWDYLFDQAVVAYGGSVWAFWTDTSSGETDIYCTKYVQQP